MRKDKKDIMFSNKKNTPHKYEQVSFESDDEEEDFIQRQIRQQQMQIRKQDEGLEMLSQGAKRLGTLSLGISEELNHQNK
jgi:hypothetical protein